MGEVGKSRWKWMGIWAVKQAGRESGVARMFG